MKCIFNNSTFLSPFFKLNKPLFSFRSCGSITIFILLISCGPDRQVRQAQLYETHCANCHIAPEIDNLPKEIWENAILPDMGARMGIRENGYNPMAGLPYEEMEAVIKTGIYPLTPTIDPEDWQLLKEYILERAPDSLPRIVMTSNSEEIRQFKPRLVSFDGGRKRSYAYLQYKPDQQEVVLSDMRGELMTYSHGKGLEVIGRFPSLVVAYEPSGERTFVTTIGNIHPSALSAGQAFEISGQDTLELGHSLHRPVHTLAEDLNGDGVEELVISEFGDLTGELSFLVKDASGKYTKRTLLNQPGTIRVVAEDMDKDGKKDLVALTSQGDESITILYQKGNLAFQAEKVLRFNPVYGSSWFELVDYEGDGDLDIVTVNGDNADKSYVQKPYHGMRIHLNDGNNSFREEYFYPMYGATRVAAADFDQDGDMDFGLLSTFPDYENAPDRTFLFLENRDSKSFDFKTFTVSDSDKAKWFLMDKGDLDGDGNVDLILSSFALPFIPAPQELQQRWKEFGVDLMILENQNRIE